MCQNLVRPQFSAQCIVSKVKAILLEGWILPIDGVASGKVCACSLRRRLNNRLGVAGAVLQTALSLSHSVSDPL